VRANEASIPVHNRFSLLDKDKDSNYSLEVSHSVSNGKTTKSEGCPETVVRGRKFKCRYRSKGDSSAPRLDIMIGKLAVNAFIDTGATLSTIKPGLVDKIARKFIHKRNKLGSRSFYVSLAIGSKKYLVDEEIELQFRVKNHPIVWRFYVVPEGTNELVIGMDFLNKYNAIINSSTKKVEIQRDLKKETVCKYKDYGSGSETVFDDSESTSSGIESCKSYRVQILKPVELQPLSYCKVQLQCSAKISSPVEITGNRKLVENHCLAVGNCIVTMNNGRAETYVLNPHSYCVKLNRGEWFGSVQEICENSIVGQLPDIDAGITGKTKENLNSLSMSGFSKETIDPDIASLRLGDHLNNDQKQRLYCLLTEYRDCFSFSLDELGCHPTAKHVLDTGVNKPVNQRPYRVSYFERQEINRQVKEMLEKGIIVESISPYASPVVLHKKPDGSYRFCCDYRRLNEITKVDVYPLPRIDDIFDRISGASFITTLDCMQGYHQIRMHENSQEKTAFITPDGKYEWKRLPFGLASAPSCFQRVMDDVLKNLKWTIALVYLDDIVVYGKTFLEHNSRLEQVLKALRKANLTLKPMKCRFAEKQIKVLGHVISEDGISVNPEKKEAVQNFPTPKSKTDVRSFLALCNFYRRFIKGMAIIAKPMYKLTEAKVPFLWNEEAEKAFCELKEILCSDTVLGFPQEEGFIEIHTDASRQGLGAILMQQQGPNKSDLRTIAFASRTLSKAEKNYHVTELECLGIIFAIKKFRPYVYGKKFRIVTDHCSLCRLINLKDPNGRLARWALMLMPYDYEIVYSKGSSHLHVDSLSRNPVGDHKSNESTFPDEYFFSQQRNTMEPLLSDLHNERSYLCALSNTTENLLTLQRKDSKLGPMIVELLRFIDGEVTTMKNLEDYKLHEGILYKANWDPDGRLWRLCVPKGMRETIMRSVHDDPAGGHLGLMKTWYTIKQRYWWPSMYKHVRKFCECCQICQTYNRRNFRTPGPLCPISPPVEPFFRIGVDYIGPFPKSKSGNKYVLTLVCHSTRYVEAWPTKDQNSSAAIDVLKKRVIYKHGCPRELLVDKGTPFQSSKFKEFCQKFKIRMLSTSAGHPQTNGIVERHNDSVKSVIAKYVDRSHHDWEDRLDAAVYSINTTVHSVHKFTPFFLVYTRDPFLPCDAVVPSNPKTMDDGDLEQRRQKAKDCLLEANRRTRADQHRRKQRFDAVHPTVLYKPGQLVLHRDYQRYVGKVSKFNRKWKGPYIVVEQKGPVNYRLETLPDKSKKIRSFVANVVELKPYFSSYKSNVFSSDENSSDSSSSSSGEANSTSGEEELWSLPTDWATSRGGCQSDRRSKPSSYRTAEAGPLMPSESEVLVTAADVEAESEQENRTVIKGSTVTINNYSSKKSSKAKSSTRGMKSDTDDSVVVRRSTRTRNPNPKYSSKDFYK